MSVISLRVDTTDPEKTKSRHRGSDDAQLLPTQFGTRPSRSGQILTYQIFEVTPQRRSFNKVYYDQLLPSIAGQTRSDGCTSWCCRLHNLLLTRSVDFFTTSSASTCHVNTYLSGSLFTHWIADSLTLWKSPVTDEHLWTAALYYSILTKGPVQILYVLFGIIILGGTTIFWSFNDLEAGNLMFDGGSICMCSAQVLHRTFITYSIS